MSALVSMHARATDSAFAPHPLNEGREPRAARIAEGAPRPAPSALLSIVVEAARGIGCVLAVAAFVAAVTVWVSVALGH